MNESFIRCVMEDNPLWRSKWNDYLVDPPEKREAFDHAEYILTHLDEALSAEEREELEELRRRMEGDNFVVK